MPRSILLMMRRKRDLNPLTELPVYGPAIAFSVAKLNSSSELSKIVDKWLTFSVQ